MQNVIITEKILKPFAKLRKNWPLQKYEILDPERSQISRGSETFTNLSFSIIKTSRFGGSKQGA